MTAEKILEKIVKSYSNYTYKVYSENKNGLESWYLEIVVLQAMNEYSVLMCEKQREICAENAEGILEYYDEGPDDFNVIVNKESIINSPLPEELQ